MSNISTSFKFHPVGQGLFYTGKINDFHFIYDCGTLSGQTIINKAIDQYLDGNNINKINLLILSHLDSDHISGLKYLKEKKIPIDYVVMPYISPFERIIHWFKSKNSKTPEYFNFLKDPISFLLEGIEIRKIYLIYSKTKDAPNTSGPESPEFGSEIEFFPKTETSYDAIHDEDREGWNKFTNRIFFTSHLSDLYIKTGHWLMRFYLRAISDEQLLKFEKCLKCKNIYSAKEAFEKLDQTKLCYKIINENLNNTNLALFHAPSERIHTQKISLSYLDNIYKMSLSRLGQILTGDLNLRMEYMNFLKHIDKYKEYVFLTQIPHHGSIRSWDPKLIKELPNCQWWVVSSKSKDPKSRHPNPQIAKDMKAYNKNYFKVNKSASVELSSRCLNGLEKLSIRYKNKPSGDQKTETTTCKTRRQKMIKGVFDYEKVGDGKWYVAPMTAGNANKWAIECDSEDEAKSIKKRLEIDDLKDPLVESEKYQLLFHVFIDKKYFRIK